jgi:hypothetical protein
MEDGLDLIAPIYAAATAYHQPASANGAVGIDDVSIGELVRTPATLAILNRISPALVHTANVPGIKPYVGIFTARYLFSNIPGNHDEEIARIDKAMRALSPEERPRYDR